MGILERIFGLKKPNLNPNPRVYDCKESIWGHCFKIANMAEGSCGGHLSPPVRVGDFALIMLKNRESLKDYECVVKFVDVENCGNPPDMFYGHFQILGKVEDIDLPEETVSPIDGFLGSPDRDESGQGRWFVGGTNKPYKNQKAG